MRVLNLRRLCLTTFAALLGGCSYEESEQAQLVSYAKNVESCMCRSLEFEADSYSGLSYAQMLDRCNRTVHDANRQRYPASAGAAPQINSLRCPDAVELWREVGAVSK